MKYEIALSPELEVSAGDFASQWNATPHCQSIATAQVATEADQVHDPAMLRRAMVILEEVSNGIERGDLYRAMEDVLNRQGVSQAVTMTPIHQTDNNFLISITEADEA